MKRHFQLPAFAWMACLSLALSAVLLLAGCRSATLPGSSSLAVVVICNTTSNAVHAATLAVFQQHVWTLREERPGVMIFEREGTRRDNRLYGNWDGNVWLRAEVRIAPYADCQLLRCDAFAVTDRGDAFYEASRKLLPISSGPYQDLLEEVKQKCAFKP